MCICTLYFEKALDFFLFVVGFYLLDVMMMMTKMMWSEKEVEKQHRKGNLWKKEIVATCYCFTALSRYSVQVPSL